jgi:hypothetical protein
MAVAAEPGFLYTEHNTPIEGQLAMGVRALLLDTYYGYRAGGRIRTDLSESIDLAAVRQEYGPEAARAVENLHLSVGTAPPAGAPLRPYLCHIACELGASGLVDKLESIRDFLDADPNEVLVLVMEDYIAPQTFEQALVEAGLQDRIWPLRPGGEIPTLRQMIMSGRTIVAMSENHGGVVDGYPSFYELAEETPYTFSSVAQFTCAANRGAPGNPFFLVNHWLRSGVAPSAVEARQVNSRDALLARMAQCRTERGRTAGIIAVNFVENGDVVGVARELNSQLPPR